VALDITLIEKIKNYETKTPMTNWDLTKGHKNDSFLRPFVK